MTSSVIVWNNFPEPVTSLDNNNNVGVFESTKNVWTFIQDVRREGFWMAVYDKPFTEVMGDFFTEVFKAIGIFLTGNGDLFFLTPALAILIGTFMVGKNKFTKWILPLIFLYWVSRMLFRVLTTN